MRVIEKVIILEDYHYVEGNLRLKVSGNKLFERKNITEFDVEDVLDAEFSVTKKYHPPNIPKGITSNRIFSLGLPEVLRTRISESGNLYEVKFDEVICDDSYVNVGGELVVHRFNTVKEGSKIYSSIELKAYGLKKISRKETETLSVYELFKNIKGKGFVEVIPNKEYYQAGEQISINAKPGKGAKFLKWGSDFKENNDRVFTVTIHDDVHLDAFFSNPLPPKPGRIHMPDKEGCFGLISTGVRVTGEVIGFLLSTIAILFYLFALFSIFGWFAPIFILIILFFAILPKILKFLFSWPVFRAILNTIIFAMVIYGITNFLKGLPERDLYSTPPEPFPETVEETLDNDSKNYIHFVEWEDYEGNLYSTYLKVNSDNVAYENRVKEDISDIRTQEEYNALLEKISSVSDESLGFVYHSLDSIRAANQIPKGKFASVIVSMVQHIPYYVIMAQTCSPNNYRESFIRQALMESPCQGFTAHGIKTPAEFLKDLKGDCDTRTLLLYVILKHYDYEVGIFGSEHYNHSLLGIANYTSNGISKSILDHHYHLWETTNKGYRPGLIPNEVQNLIYWQPNLY